MKEGDTIKIKRPLLAYQENLRYIITKVNGMNIECYEIDNPDHIYTVRVTKMILAQ